MRTHRTDFQTFAGTATQTATASYSLTSSISGIVASNSVTDNIADGEANTVTVTDMIPLLLQPDTYVFTIAATNEAIVNQDAFASGRAGFDFLIEVPEPASTTLGIVALATVALLRRMTASV